MYLYACINLRGNSLCTSVCTCIAHVDILKMHDKCNTDIVILGLRLLAKTVIILIRFKSEDFMFLANPLPELT